MICCFGGFEFYAPATKHAADTRKQMQAGQSWGKSSAPSVMDVLVKNAAKLPAPGQYGNPSVSQISGGKWSTFHSKSDLDWIVYRASKLPAPGQYGNPSQSMIAGGRFGKSSVPGSVDLLQARARKLPGPGQVQRWLRARAASRVPVRFQRVIQCALYANATTQQRALEQRSWWPKPNVSVSFAV